MTGQFKSATPRALSEEITIGVGSKLAQRPMSAADHERALAMIEQRTDLNDEQRAMMRASVEKHYLNATLNG